MQTRGELPIQTNGTQVSSCWATWNSKTLQHSHELLCSKKQWLTEIFPGLLFPYVCMRVLLAIIAFTPDCLMTVKWLTHDHEMRVVRQKGNQTHCPSLETKSSKPLMVTQTMDNRVQEGLASYQLPRLISSYGCAGGKRRWASWNSLGRRNQYTQNSMLPFHVF